MLSTRAQRRISIVLIVIVVLGLIALSMAPGGGFVAAPTNLVVPALA